MEETYFCPYCTNKISDKSKDHIFSQFLGGTRKIPSCRDCNNDVFGRGFEGRVSKNINTWHVIISNWGVDFKAELQPWKNVQTNKKNLNVEVVDRRLEASMAQPVIEKNEDGSFKSGSYRSRREAEQNRKSLIEKGIADDSVQIEEDPGEVENYVLKYSFNFSNDLFRLIIKMCCGLATMLPDFDLSELDTARKYITGKEREGAVSDFDFSFDTYEIIDHNRSPMSHVIYVERVDRNVLGLVQLFGSFQFACKLGTSPTEKADRALMATLDPISGAEQFSEIDPIPIGKLPAKITDEEKSANVLNWVKKFQEEAAKLGAENHNTEIYGVTYSR